MTKHPSQNVSLPKYTAVAQRAANQVIRQYSTSFGMATQLLGRRHRQHIRSVYALVRVADEIVDGVTEEAGLDAQQRQEVFGEFVASTEAALQLGYSSDLIIHSFAHSARATGIDAALIGPFFASMRTDLDASIETDPKQFSRAEHGDYVYGSAEVIGLMCLRIFTCEAQLTTAQRARLEYGARQLGAAFQNINFLRDLADDTGRLGRSYLSTQERLTEVEKREWTREIRGQLAEAAAAIPLLPHDARAAVRSAAALFAELTRRIERVPAARLYSERIRVPNPHKARLIANSLLQTRLEPRT